MQLNIKSNEAYELATRLSELTGENRTAAVTQALRDKVTQLEREREVGERIRRVLALASDMRAELAREGKPLSLDIDSLYDPDTGLPA